MNAVALALAVVVGMAGDDVAIVMVTSRLSGRFGLICLYIDTDYT